MVTFDYEAFRRMLSTQQKITSVRRVADGTGIQFTRLWRITQGIYNPTVDELCAICSYMQVDPTQFFRVRMFTERMI